MVVYFRYLGTYAHHSAPLAVVVARHVYRPSGLEVGVEVELFAVQVSDGCIA